MITELSRNDLEDLASLYSHPGFKVLCDEIKSLKELTKDQLVNAPVDSIIRLQAQYSAYSSVLETVQSADGLLHAKQQQSQDLEEFKYNATGW